MLTKGKLHIARPAHEVALSGGAASYELEVGSHVFIHPAHDLFARGVCSAEVRGWDARGVLFVRPYVGGRAVRGKLQRLHPDYVLAPRSNGHAQDQ